jgi:sialate O-acetylesterase
MRTSIISRVVFCLFGFFALQSAYSYVRLPRLISNGMVLQRNVAVRVWGWASPGEKVIVRFLGRADTAATGDDGQWAAMLPPMKAGGPYSMEIDGSNHIVLNDILIGDVWVCSGQSNMQLPMARVAWKYPDVIAHSENDNIRQLIVPNTYDFSGPKEDIQWAQWQPANPWTVLQFSAAAYFFARNLYEKYHVPIGLINASVGGTPIEAWMSKDALKEFPAILETGEKFSSSAYRDSVTEKNNSTYGTWNSKAWEEDEGLKGEKPWYDPTYDDADWQTMKLPGYWSDEGLPVPSAKNVNGVVWFRKEFNVPASLAGKPAKLIMGRIVDGDYDYVNGVFVGSVSYQYPPRRYDVAPGLLKAGKNTVVVRVISQDGRGGFIKDKQYAVVIGNHAINLAGNWKYKVGVAEPPMPFGGPTIIYQPTGCFNAMIAPLLNYTIKGVIWYQGESNASFPQGYAKKFESMIADWRVKWHEGDFSFIYVQLPNYGEPFDHPVESGMAALREAQLQTLSVPNTGMAVTIDIGEWNDIHPLDKGDVGKRLALAAEKIAYGDNTVVYSGPIYKSIEIKGNKAVISFTHIGKGLVAKGRRIDSSSGPLKTFEICGADGKYVWAKATIKGDNVIVWSDSVSTPTAVRYAWADTPVDPNLYNKEGLPASPFETGK